MPQKLGGTACRHNAPDRTNKQASSPHVWDRYEAEERTLPPLKKQTSNFVLTEQKQFPAFHETSWEYHAYSNNV